MKRTVSAVLAIILILSLAACTSPTGGSEGSAVDVKPGEPLSAEQLAAKIAENKQYMVDATAAYPMPEDGADFLPYFATFEPEVLDEALGVTMSAPREITDTTNFCRDLELGTNVTRCALITNNSDKRVQLIPANDLTEADWKTVEGYDPSLVID